MKWILPAAILALGPLAVAVLFRFLRAPLSRPYVSSAVSLALSILSFVIGIHLLYTSSGREAALVGYATAASLAAMTALGADWIEICFFGFIKQFQNAHPLLILSGYWIAFTELWIALGIPVIFFGESLSFLYFLIPVLILLLSICRLFATQLRQMT